jgi:hypothetical protein
VHVSTIEDVDRCAYLGDFVGSRRLVGDWASDQVRNIAAKSGATDIVFDGHARGEVVAKGYRCP